MPYVVSILIIGSLIWKDSPHRESWRQKRLVLDRQKRVRAPIRYGRLSASQSYTMVLSNELAPDRLGWALAVPCRCRANTVNQLVEEAEALWAAEQSETTEPGPLAARWGCVGLLCNPNSVGLDAVQQAWSHRVKEEHRIYQRFPHVTNELPAVDAAGRLTMPWPTMESGEALDADLVLATATVPTLVEETRYATSAEVAEPWNDAQRRNYFDKNREFGISTAFDAEIRQALDLIAES